MKSAVWILKMATPALCVAGLASLAACGSNDKNDVADAGKNLTREPGLQGYWVSTCDAFPVLKNSGKAFYAFEPLRYSKKIAVYSEKECSTLEAEVLYKGEFKVGTSDDLPTGNRVDLTPKTVSVRAVSEAGVRTLNVARLCGISDWAINASRDVTDAATRTGCVSEKPGVTQYDIYHLESKKLQFGSAYLLGAPTDSGKRPAELNQRVFSTSGKWE